MPKSGPKTRQNVGIMAASASDRRNAPASRASFAPGLPPDAPDYGFIASGPGARALRASRTEYPEALRALEERVAHDLACLNYPPPNWVPPVPGPDGADMLDVLVAGAGMCGQTVAYALRREGVLGQRVLDARAEGLEGPWATHARMEILRSPKHLTGPDLGVPSMTFRAWYEAKFGLPAWDALHKVWRLDWRDYLLWVRRMAGVTVEQGARLVHVEPAARGLRVRLETEAGAQQLHVRKLVLALGREGSGGARFPAFASLEPASQLARARVFHSTDDIDFERFKGARIGVLGAGASAFDNAGCALEAGAREVAMFVRRSVLPQVNKSKWTSFPGFFRGYPSLPDAQRLRFYRHVFEEQVPPPFESVLRCDRHPGFVMRLGEPWLDVRVDAQGVEVQTHAGWERFDAVIFGTGFDVDLRDRPELKGLVEHVATWSDVAGAFGTERSATDEELGRFPDLGEGFELRARAGAPAEIAEALGRIHLFNWGSTISHGAVAGDIPGLAPGASKLAAAVARDLFIDDVERHHDALLAHSEQELLYTKRWNGEPGPGPRLK